MSEISGSKIEGAEIKQTPTVGEVFIQWAETYWHLDQKLEAGDPDSFAGEKCTYPYMRSVFIAQINSIIKEKLGL